MSGNDWAEVVGALGIFAFIITIVTVIVVQVGATVRAKAALAREDEYRKLAERTVLLQEAIEKRLVALDEQAAQTQTRLTSIERILTQVE
jgi:multidrug efflux pump subunit AcrA (membrane-fusion protein)